MAAGPGSFSTTAPASRPAFGTTCGPRARHHVVLGDGWPLRLGHGPANGLKGRSGRAERTERPAAALAVTACFEALDELAMPITLRFLELAPTEQTRLSTGSFAVDRRQELYAQLAENVPEFAFWADQVDHRATREGMRPTRS